MTPEYCPRCAARHGVHAKVFLSSTPARLFGREDRDMTEMQPELTVPEMHPATPA